jgi:glycerophosphoryl diester phosphodiesterase
VVMHDSTLDRTTNAVELWGDEEIAVWSKTMDELRELDAGGWFGPWFGGVGVPSVAEVLDVIQPGSISLIERKRGDAATIVRLLREKEMLDDVVVQAFDWAFLADCHALAPGVVLGALGPPRQADGSRYPPEQRYMNAEFLDRVEASGARIVGWNHRWVTEEGIREARDRGLQVWLYTINDLDTTLRFLEMGVDGIISDNPPMVWKAIALHSIGKAATAE